MISGEEEARLAFLAATAGLDLAAGRSWCSTPAAAARSSRFGDGVAVAEQFSVPVGAVRLTEHFGLDRAVSAERSRDAPRSPPSSIASTAAPRPSALIGMGGAVTNLAAIKHGLAGTTLTPSTARG